MTALCAAILAAWVLYGLAVFLPPIRKRFEEKISEKYRKKREALRLEMEASALAHIQEWQIIFEEKEKDKKGDFAPNEDVIF